jgi:hypothetical protein
VEHTIGQRFPEGLYYNVCVRLLEGPFGPGSGEVGAEDKGAGIYGRDLPERRGYV